MDIQMRFMRILQRHEFFMRAYNQEELTNLIIRITSLQNDIQKSDFSIFRELLFPTQVYLCELQSSNENIQKQLSLMKDNLNPDNVRKGNIFLQFLNNFNPGKGRPFKKASTNWVIHELSILFIDSVNNETQWQELAKFLLQEEGTRLSPHLAKMLVRYLEGSLLETKEKDDEVLDAKLKIALVADRLKKRNENWIEKCSKGKINPSLLNEEDGSFVLMPVTSAIISKT